MTQTLVRPPGRRPPSHRRPPRYLYRRLVAILLVVTLGLLLWRSGAIGSLFKSDKSTSAQHQSPQPAGQGRSSQPSTGASSRKPSTSAPAPTAAGYQTPRPINSAFPGLTTFRGNASRTYYGQGPIPSHPKILWRYPSTGGMCHTSSNVDGTRVWCGMGWTGQPNVIERQDGQIEIRFGAYDGNYHFLDGMTGEHILPDLVTGDLTKGSATTDADGFPLYYGGSRDNYLRVIATDRSKPTVLWSVNANDNPGKKWNDDWDGAPLQIGDYLLEGGENSWFYAIRLNRHYDSAGLVQVNPKIVMLVPGYDEQQFADLGDQSVSIENSVAFRDGVVYFANSGGLVQGWDISDILKGGTRYSRVFRFWDGDETDASIVIDQEGYLFVGRHASYNIPSRPQTRDHEVGSLMKLDPHKPKDPVVWSVQIGGFEPDGGILGTPALYKGIVWVNKTEGGLIGVDQKTGKIISETSLPGPTWNSPVPIDDQILVGDCAGVLHDFDISDPKNPKELWTIQLEGCIEATPAVWKGMIWIGSRGGPIYAIGDAK
jgi:hypothetical protein